MVNDQKVQTMTGWRKYVDIFANGFVEGFGWAIGAGLVVLIVYSLRS